MSKTQPTKLCCHFPKIGHCWHCDNRNKEVFISQITKPCPLWNDIKPKPTKLFTEEDVLEIIGSDIGHYVIDKVKAEQLQRLSDKKEGK